MEKFTFTVGKLDAGMAILIGERAHLIEFPSILLPPGVSSGSIVNISVNRNQAAENAHLSEFWALQDQILNEYGIDLPVAPELKLRHITQTSVTLEWPHIELAKADIRGLEIYKNGQRLALIPNPKSNTSTKLSSLQSNEEYTFQLVLKTTAGTFPSNIIKVRTHTMNDTSGISVCFGSIQDQNLLAHAKAALKQMKAKWTESIEIDTTHFVCQAAGPAENNYNPTSEYLKAVQLSLPIVQPQWILACQIEKKLVPVSSFQLGADTPHKYRPQGKLAEEDEQEPRPNTRETAVVTQPKVPETANDVREPSTEEIKNQTDTATQDTTPAPIASEKSDTELHHDEIPQRPDETTETSAGTESHEAGNESPSSAPRSPKPEADGKLDRAFKFPVSSASADEKTELSGAPPAAQSEIAAVEENATDIAEATPVEVDKPVDTQPVVEEPEAAEDSSVKDTQVSPEPVTSLNEEQSRPEPTTSDSRQPESKKTDPDVDVAARQWLSGQKPVDASGEEEDHSSKVLDDVLVKKAAAQAEKEAAVAAPTLTQPVESEEVQQADVTPVVEVQKDHGEVVKVAEESTPLVEPSQSEVTPNLEEPVEDGGEEENANEEEGETPADSAVPTPSESPAPQEGETPVTGGSKKKKNKKKSKK